jgi:hypothetical protein
VSADVFARPCAARACLFAVAVVLSALGWTGSAASQSTTAPSVPAVTPPPSAATPDADVQSLRERAAAFWAARVAGDFVAQWELLEPRGRGRMTPLEYAAPFGAVKYLAYQVEEVTVNGHFASVTIRAITQTVLPTAGRRAVPPGAILFPDRWIKIRGTWYRNVDQEPASGQAGTQR